MPRHHQNRLCSNTEFEGSLHPDCVSPTSSATDALDPLCCAGSLLQDEPIPESCTLCHGQIAHLGAAFHSLGDFFFLSKPLVILFASTIWILRGTLAAGSASPG